MITITGTVNITLMRMKHSGDFLYSLMEEIAGVVIGVVIVG